MKDQVEPVIRQLGYLFGWYTKPARHWTPEVALSMQGAPQHIIVAVNEEDGTIGDVLASCTTIEAATAAGRLLSGTAANLHRAMAFGRAGAMDPRLEWKPPVGFRDTLCSDNEEGETP